MGMKKFEVTVEVIEVLEVVVYAENFADAADRGNKLTIAECKEGCVNDHEKRVTGVQRYTDSRMYR